MQVHCMTHTMHSISQGHLLKEIMTHTALTSMWVNVYKIDLQITMFNKHFLPIDKDFDFMLHYSSHFTFIAAILYLYVMAKTFLILMYA